MAEGYRTYDGMAVPLLGESEIKQQSIAYDILTLTSAASNASDFLVVQNSGNTELFRIEDDSAIWQSITSAEGAGCNIRSYRYLSANSTGQSYAAQFLLDESTNDVNVGGGRHATLYVRFSAATGGGAAAARSFINFDDHGTPCPALFTLPSTGPTSGGCFETVTDNAITHGLVIYCANTKYWIAVLSTSA